MKKIWSGLRKRFFDAIGVSQERETANNWFPESPKGKRFRIPRWRARNWHPDKRMRRGVEIAKERKQRGSRLARILASQLQGIAVRKAFRSKQLEQRLHRQERERAGTDSRESVAAAVS